MQDLSDSELVQRAQSRQENLSSGVEAVHELYDRYHQPVFRYLWARLADRQLAEDLTGDVFVRMISALPKYRATSVPFQAWLYSIARNLVIDQYRKVGRKQELSLEDFEPVSQATGDPAQTIEQSLFAEQVHKGLQLLDLAQQEILVLRFINGLSLQEVADMVGKTVGAVKIAQHRGLKHLRVILNLDQGEGKENEER